MAGEKGLRLWGRFHPVGYRLAVLCPGRFHPVGVLVVAAFVGRVRLRGEIDRGDYLDVVFSFSAQLYRET